MSVDCWDAEPVDFYRAATVRARKEHRCHACKEAILPGHTYHRAVLGFDGDIEEHVRCARCQIIYKHLGALCVAAGADEAPDPRLNCGHEYVEKWGVEPPPEIAALAFALPGEVELKR